MAVQNYCRCQNNDENSHTNAKLMQHESLSNSDTCVVDISNQKTTSEVETSSKNSCVIIRLNVVDNTSSIVNIENLTGTDYVSNTSHVAVVNPIIDSSNKKESDDDISVTQENRIKANQESLNHQAGISQDESSESDVAAESKRLSLKQEMRRNIRSASVNVTKTHYYKVSLVFAICCIIGFCMVPIIFYYANQTGENDATDPEFSHEINLLRICDYSALDSDCVDQILYTYEALRTINLPSSQQYCSERVETLFCDALMECSNESYVKDIVCQQVRQEYCTAEWRMLEVNNQTDGLIDCEEYEETAPLNCGDQFDVTNDESVCLPLCGEFSQYNEAHATSRIVLLAIFLSIGALGGIVIIGISCKKRKKMFHFPQVLVVMNAGILTILYSSIAISSILSFYRRDTLCSRKFLFDALDNPTTFCTVQGSLLSSGTVLFSFFWVLYTSHLVLKLSHPLRSFKIFHSDYSKAIYIAEILIALFIASAPSVVGAGLSKYRIVSFSPTHCEIYGAYRFYSLILPVMIAVCVSVILMMLALYKIHVSHGIFKKQQDPVGKQVCTCNFTVPEVKIVFVIFYWLVQSVIFWTISSIRAGRADIVDNQLRNFADCMAGGNRKDHDCRQLRMDLEAETIPVLEGIALVLVAFLSFATLFFVVQFKAIKDSVMQAIRNFNTKVRSKSSYQSSRRTNRAMGS